MRLDRIQALLNEKTGTYYNPNQFRWEQIVYHKDEPTVVGWQGEYLPLETRRHLEREVWMTFIGLVPSKQLELFGQLPHPSMYDKEGVRRRGEGVY